MYKYDGVSGSFGLSWIFTILLVCGKPGHSRSCLVHSMSWLAELAAFSAFPPGIFQIYMIILMA